MARCTGIRRTWLTVAAMVLTTSALAIGADIDESQVQVTLHVDAERGSAGGDGSAGRPFASITAGLKAAMPHLAAGRATRVLVQPGTYRESAGRLEFDKGQAKQTLLVLEGTDPAQCVWSGSDVFPAEAWKPVGEGVFAAPWPHELKAYSPEWGVKNYLGHRTEMVYINGWPLRQKLVEVTEYEVKGTLKPGNPREQTYTYQGVRDPREVLEPGDFGVAERDDSGPWANHIFIRPDDPSVIQSGTIEVAVRPQLASFAPKHNLVLRNLTFTHAAAGLWPKGIDGPLAFDRSGHLRQGDYEHVLMDNCRFVWNNYHGLNPPGGEYWTVRDCEFSYNGFSGIGGGMRKTLMERNKTNFNNWRGYWGDVTSWFMGGCKFHNTEDQIIRGHESIGNLASGFWYDIHCERVEIEDLVVAYNTRNLFFELSNGPFIVRRSVAAMASDRSFNMSIVGRAEIHDSIIYNNQGGTWGNQKQPLPLAHVQWYKRDDPHAKQRPLQTGPVLIEGTVIAGGPEQQAVLSEKVAVGNDPLYKDYRWIGRNNVYFVPNPIDKPFVYVDGEWQSHRLDFKGWLELRNERGTVWQDPKFVNPMALDFRLESGSPLESRADELPTIQVNPATLDAMRRFHAWVGWDRVEAEVLDQ